MNNNDIFDIIEKSISLAVKENNEPMLFELPDEISDMVQKDKLNIRFLYNVLINYHLLLKSELAKQGIILDD